MLFNLFNVINYNGVELRNITQSILLKFTTLDNAALYTNYVLGDVDTAQSLAYKEYGDASYDFVIYMMNNIIDPVHDWYLSYTEIKAISISKYGDEAYQHIHHLIDSDTGDRVNQYDEIQYVRHGTVIQPLPLHYIVVTNIDYELSLNEEKKYIKILSNSYLEDFMDELEQLLANDT